MPIIQSEKRTKPQKIKFIIDANLLDEIKGYCAWAKVENEGAFFIQAAEFVLRKDKEWKMYKRKKG